MSLSHIYNTGSKLFIPIFITAAGVVPIASGRCKRYLHAHQYCRLYFTFGPLRSLNIMRTHNRVIF